MSKRINSVALVSLLLIGAAFGSSCGSNKDQNQTVNPAVAGAVNPMYGNGSYTCQIPFTGTGVYLGSGNIMAGTFPNGQSAGTVTLGGGAPPYAQYRGTSDTGSQIIFSTDGLPPGSGYYPQTQNTTIRGIFMISAQTIQALSGGGYNTTGTYPYNTPYSTPYPGQYSGQYPSQYPGGYNPQYAQQVCTPQALSINSGIQYGSNILYGGYVYLTVGGQVLPFHMSGR